MKFLATLFLLLVLSAGCSSAIDVDAPNMGITRAVRECPTINLPASLRQKNWDSRKGEGSCCHATVVNLLRWQNQLSLANHWRRTYSGGEDSASLADKLDREGIPYAYTTSGDVGFLQWAVNTRRGCGVTIHSGHHMVTLVEFNDEWAGLLDENDAKTIHWVPRDTFLAEWNGWAFAILGTPPPPLP